MGSTRSRLLIFGALLVGCLGGSVAVIKLSGASGNDRIVRAHETSAVSAANARALSAGGVVVFRNLGPQPGGGRYEIAWVPASHPSGPRHFLGLSCGRVYFTAGHGECLGFDTRPIPGYRDLIFDSSLHVEHSIGLAGPVSRARVSPDGRYASTTVFVTGHSYASIGTFSTATRIVELSNGDQLPNLEQFHDTDNGQPVTATDRNYWGITFARDSNTFYATRGEGLRTWLVEGNIQDRTLRTIHTNVACPSLSPDGTLIAFKKQVAGPQYKGGAVRWRFAVLDLRTGRETMLAEQRSIDDQLEWLDNRRLLYSDGLNIDVVNADGSGRPEVFIPNADSPAVVRTPAAGTPGASTSASAG
jgi:hypothetical protein